MPFQKFAYLRKTRYADYIRFRHKSHFKMFFRANLYKHHSRLLTVAPLNFPSHDELPLADNTQKKKKKINFTLINLGQFKWLPLTSRVIWGKNLEIFLFCPICTVRQIVFSMWTKSSMLKGTIINDLGGGQRKSRKKNSEALLRGKKFGEAIARKK